MSPPSDRKRVAVLGSTGSIGVSTLKVLERHRTRFQAVGLAAHRSAVRLREQAARHPDARIVLGDPTSSSPDPDWQLGRDAVCALCEAPDVDVVVNAIVGAAGLEPTLRSLEAGKRLALANKESLVAGGPLVMDAARRGGGELVPIDSEHSAILQCLRGHAPDEVRRIVLTASGGPFRGWDREEIAAAGPAEALQHPTWAMGDKISIDSATLANKALEVIEAHFLYGISYDAIDVVVHPQSIVHSFVEFRDGSVLAQLGFPTMELPILIALSHPERVADPDLATFDPIRGSPLTFEAVDRHAFPLFDLGVRAGRLGGAAPAVYNAANEVAVRGFLKGRIRFPGMAEVVGETLERIGSPPVSTVTDVLEADGEARRMAGALLDGTVRAGTGSPRG